MLLARGQAPETIQESLEKYSPKSCKYSLIPASLGSRAYKAYTGEVHVYDVFGMPSTVKRHITRLDIDRESLVTLQAEVHRDTPTTLTADIFRRGQAGKPSGRILLGKNSIGAGGDNTKAFVHGLLNEKEHGEIDIVFELAAVEVAAAQVDGLGNKERCYAVRIDLTVVPTSRAALHWPTSCAAEARLPDTAGSSATEIVALPDAGLSSGPPMPGSGQHFTFRFGDERPWEGFGRALWSSTIEVPPRLHRFIRLFFRTSFRFASAPLQLVLELFDLADEPDSTALVPQCAMGCLGGVPVYNGQILDHAMPTGFRYRIWLMAASLEEWTATMPDRGRHCIDFNFDYSIKFEQKLTPFEVGPSAWLCEFTNLPVRIVQTANPGSHPKAKENVQLVAGRTIWIRDRFGFPPQEISDMEHQIEVVVTEQCIFRATTHHSDGVDVFLALQRKGDQARACAAFKHPGPVPRQTIFCRLEPGTYVLTVFADYPLGGLHPCSDFFMQVALRPTVLSDATQTSQCLSAASDLSRLKVQRSAELASSPNWKTVRVPIKLQRAPSSVQIWAQSIEIAEEEEAQHLYLRMVVHSDYVSSDLRFQVKFGGKYIADTQVTSHGYADMIGPLDAGTYNLAMYYVTGIGPETTKLCSTSMVDLRVVSKSQYTNRTATWLCSSTRVPPPDALTPQPDEQVLLDSDYVVPSTGVHTLRLKVTEPRIVRVQTGSVDADFLVQLRDHPALTLIAAGENHLEALVGQGTFALRIKAQMRSMGNGAACSTMRLNLLLQPVTPLPQCPWAAGASLESSGGADSAQVQANDHIGTVLLDLVPQQLTKDVQPKPPVTLWMNQGMEKSFEMAVDSSAAMRLDVVVQPPFLPLEVTVRRKRASGKLEPPLATAEWLESRLLLLQNDLPKGTYVVRLAMPRKYSIQSSSGIDEGQLNLLCAHVTIIAEVGVSSTDDRNSMRAELLDLPDLLAVQPFPTDMNMVGWLPTPALAPVLGTQVYNFPDGSGTASLVVDEKAVLRTVCEPADLSNTEATMILRKEGGQEVARADSLGQLAIEIDAGSFTLQLTPKAKAPFLVTLGVATKARLREDILLQDSSRSCRDTIPNLAKGVVFSPRGWSFGPTLVRLKSSFVTKDGILTEVPIEVQTSSILYIEAGSSLPLDLIRIAISVPEGIWVGEQRAMRNSLHIELPPGKYSIQLSQPMPIGFDINRCIDFSVYVVATPLNPDAAADAEAAGSMAATGEGEKRAELAPREEASVESAPCFSMGTAPLPLDLSHPAGGSTMLGGPIGQDGRLLVRARVLLTDMHDGRKKVYLSTKRQKLVFKVGILMGGYSRLSMANQLTFSVTRIGAPVQIEPVESWAQENGWERIFILDETSSGYWLTFHHSHSERGESACVHFGLGIEIHPFDDTRRMFQCSSQTAQPEDIFPSSLNVDQSESNPKSFRYYKRMAWLRQQAGGFITSTRFTLRVPSFVSAEVAYNYFLSHAEMDIVSAKDTLRPVVTAESDFLHDADHPLNIRQLIGRVLEPGDYILRVADDHYKGQLDGVDAACFPFSVDLQIAPNDVGSPAVVSVRPHPSVPIPIGLDLVVTLRFSEPPGGSIEDVIGAFSLGGVQAVAGGSVDSMKGQYASLQRTTAVQADTTEDYHVWVIGWSAQVLSSLGGKAKLTIGPIRSNRSKQLYTFIPPTYTVVQAPRGTPWSGEASRQSSGGQTPPSVGTIGGVRGEMPGQAAASAPQAPQPPPPTPSRGSGSGGLGEVHMEGGSVASSAGSAPAPAAQAPSYPSRSYGEVKPDVARPSYTTQEEYEPTIEQWQPAEDSSGKPKAPGGGAGCPEGTVMNGVTGACDSVPVSSSSLSVPSGYSSFISLCLASMVLLAVLLNCWPQLRGMLLGAVAAALGGSRKSGHPAARFSDIGARSAEEEQGLVARPEGEVVGNSSFDDDML